LNRRQTEIPFGKTNNFLGGEDAVLSVHHAARLNLILDNVRSETSAGGLIDVLFSPGLDGHQIGFAVGEAVAHLNHLVALEHMQMIEDRFYVRYRRIVGDGQVILFFDDSLWAEPANTKGQQRCTAL
jgi:hypothetical protein